MQGAYGGLIVILIYAAGESVIEQEQYLITQNGEDILTSSAQRILVNKEE